MKPVLPGSTIGVLGSGQLGRMFALSARRMGYRVHTFSPEVDTPTGQVSDLEITSPYSDLDRVRDFARNVSVVTFEFENVPAETAAAAAEYVEVRPRGSILHTTQNRIREKSFLAAAGLPVTPFTPIESLEELRSAIQKHGCPCILKTAGFGYDGQGQVRIPSSGHADASWDSLSRASAVLETAIDFECEISVVAARGADGEFAHYGAIQNSHERHILDVSVSPPSIPQSVRNEAISIARTVLESLDVVGVLCIEFFLTRDGKLLINELAPRPHNSGHFTVDANVTSQFEQQLRAICGLPLGSTEQIQPAAMANLLGDLWENGEPDWASTCKFPNVKLHLYGKQKPRAGRKMGHITAIGEGAEQTVRAARAALTGTSRH